MKLVKPSGIEGKVNAPASKSMMQRAVGAALLARGTSEITNPSLCEDALAALRIVEALGATVKRSGESILISGGLREPKERRLDCGESGLCMRMFAPIAALYEEEIVLTGRGTLLERPVGMVKSGLLELGARVGTNKGNPPIRVQGPISAGRLMIEGSTTSQFLSGLLMALPVCAGDSEISVEGLKSRPYVSMTVSLLRDFRVSVSHDEEMSLFEIPGGQEYRPSSYNVEGDWSGASFLLVAGAVAGRVEVANLTADSLQADRAVLGALESAGAKVTVGESRVSVEKGGLKPFEFDASDCPDLFPPLVALAANCPGKSVIRGADRLVHKESNRAQALSGEFGKIGVQVGVSGDTMEIHGGKIQGGSADSRGDHRIAMALAVAALNSGSGVSISGEECVSKSYPGFFGDLEKLMVR